MQSLKPKVAVLVPCYKRPEYTEQCLKSIQDAQDYPNVYFQLRNDGSEDCTNEIFKEFEKKYGIRNEYTWEFKSNESTHVWHNDQGKREGLRGQIINFFNLIQGFPEHYDFICKVDNDCLVPKNWLKDILKVFAETDVDILSPNVYPSNAAFKYGKIVEGLPYMSAEIVGGLWCMRASLIQDMFFQRHEVEGLTGAVALLRQIINEKEPKVGWLPNVVVQDLGHWSGDHPECIKTAEHEAYYNEVGREISWNA